VQSICARERELWVSLESAIEFLRELCNAGLRDLAGLSHKQKRCGVAHLN